LTTAPARRTERAPTTDGRLLHPHLLSQAFNRLVVRSGVPRIRLHDLRQTHATLLLKAGVPLEVVSERLGHSTPAFTVTTYQHVRPGMQHDAALLFAPSHRAHLLPYRRVTR
jgi:integrase